MLTDPRFDAINGIERLPIQDSKTKEKVSRTLEKLERYFPEHKVFALSSIDDKLREECAGLAKAAGYSSQRDFLAAYGFEVISGDAVRSLRSIVVYEPGQEPECVKSKVESICERLQTFYPDHVIAEGLQKSHKSLSGDISGMYQWLGYPDSAAFLQAYGFDYQINDKGGRPATVDIQAILDALTKKYQTQPKPGTVEELRKENPEYAGQMKTIQNRAHELFHMSAVKYFKQIGILSERSSRKKAAALEALYETLDPSVYGTWEQAETQLTGMRHGLRNGMIALRSAERTLTEAVIPYGIEVISSAAFFRCRQLKSVILPASVRVIERGAFQDCTALEQVILPEGLLEIGESAFADCETLTSIVIPASVRSIGHYTFDGCTNLTQVTLPHDKIEIHGSAFRDCGYHYTVPQDIGATDADLFSAETGYQGGVAVTGYHGPDGAVIIPSWINGYKVTTIGPGAFSACAGLSKIDTR